MTRWTGECFAAAGGTLAVFGLGPVGQFASRIGRHLGYRVIGIEPVAERRAMAERHGIETMDPSAVDDVPGALQESTGGRGPDSVIDAVGMEAHGSAGATVGKLAQAAAGMLPDTLAQTVFEMAGIDRLTALQNAISAARRGGTVSVSGVYGSTADPMPMLDLFDKQIQLRMGQCNVKRWIGDILPLVEDSADPRGVLDLTTHAVPIAEAPQAYKTFDTARCAPSAPERRRHGQNDYTHDARLSVSTRSPNRQNEWGRYVQHSHPQAFMMALTRRPQEVVLTAPWPD